MIKYAQIVRDTIVDGIGLRDTLYVSGCPHNCPGCHNKALQDYNYGEKDTKQIILDKLLESDNDLTISGGEPFEQSKELSLLLIEYKKHRPQSNIWIYSGYRFEEIKKDEDKFALLKLCDVLVDGKFVESLKSLELVFRGSSNQRIIDVKKSLENDDIILIDLDKDKCLKTKV